MSGRLFWGYSLFFILCLVFLFRKTFFKTKYLIIFGLLLFFSSLVLTGYGVYSGNHAYQIPLIDILNNPKLYPGDPLAAATPYYCTMLWRVVALGLRVINLESLFLCGFLIERLLLIFAAGYLAFAFVPKSRLAVVGAMSFFALAPSPILGGGGLVGDYFEQTGLSILFFLLAIASFYRFHRILWAIWFSIGFNLNSMYGAYALTYLLCVFLFDSDYRNEWKKWISPALLAAVLSSPALILTLSTVRKTPDDAILWLKAVRLRSPFHLYPLTWSKSVFINFGMLILLTVGVLYQNRLIAKKLLKHGIIWTMVAAGWLVYAFIAAYVIKLPIALLMQPARGPDLWYCFAAIALISVFAARLEKENKNDGQFMLMAFFASIFLWRPIPYPLICAGIILLSLDFIWGPVFKKGNPMRIATVLALSVALFSSYQLYQRKLNFFVAMPRQSIKEIADWAKKTTPAEACFLINPTWGSGWQIFRALSKRPVFVTWKDGTAIHWNGSFVKPWSERLKALGFDVMEETNPYKDSLYEKLRDDDVKILRERYSIDYWIVDNNHPSDFPIVYQNRDYKVLKLK